MPQYMLQFAYTPETWAALTANPVDRSEPVRALAQKFDGRLIDLFYTMGEYDGVVIVELPDDVSAMGFVLAATSPGHLRATKTTRLMPPEEAMQAMQKARGIGYTAPGR